MIAALRAPVFALLASLLGVVLAYLWFSGRQPAAIAIGVVMLLVGAGSQFVGELLLPGNPVRALRLLEGWSFTQLGLSAVAAAVTVIVTVELAAGDSASDDTKELLSTLSTGLGTFVTAALVQGTDPDATTGDRVKAVFRAHWKRSPGAGQPPGTVQNGIKYVGAGSDAERLVYGDGLKGLVGWDHDSRAGRAEALASASVD